MTRSMLHSKESVKETPLTGWSAAAQYLLSRKKLKQIIKSNTALGVNIHPNTEMHTGPSEFCYCTE